jgi:hypothetical protein
MKSRAVPRDNSRPDWQKENSWVGRNGDGYRESVEEVRTRSKSTSVFSLDKISLRLKFSDSVGPLAHLPITCPCTRIIHLPGVSSTSLLGVIHL